MTKTRGDIGIDINAISRLKVADFSPAIRFSFAEDAEATTTEDSTKPNVHPFEFYLNANSINKTSKSRQRQPFSIVDSLMSLRKLNKEIERQNKLLREKV